MPTKFIKLPVRVVLQSTDGETEHASGELSLSIVKDALLLSRNGRIHMLDKEASGRGATIYKEVRLPYVITEF